MARKFGGADLGLAVFVKLLNDLSGRADLSSKINVGTKWTLYLPNKEPGGHNRFNQLASAA